MGTKAKQSGGIKGLFGGIFGFIAKHPIIWVIVLIFTFGAYPLFVLETVFGVLGDICGAVANVINWFGFKGVGK